MGEARQGAVEAGWAVVEVVGDEERYLFTHQKPLEEEKDYDAYNFENKK